MTSPSDDRPPVVRRELDPLFSRRVPRGRMVLIVLGILTLVTLCAVVTALSATSADHGRATLVP